MQEKKEESQENKDQNESETTDKEILPVEEPASDDQDRQEDDDEKFPLSEEAEETGEGLIQGHGCLRGCLIPVIVIFGIILILILAIYAKQDSIDNLLLRRILANTEKHVMMVLPEDMGKDEIETVFGNVRKGLKEKQVDEENLTRIMSEYHDAMKKDISVNSKKKEIDKLIKGLNDSIIASGQ